jgi:uncharacterized cofD-like protein
MADSHPSIDADALTAVVTVTDDGGSSGRLREQFGVLPPGDIRNCLVALARKESPIAEFLQRRLPCGVSADGGHPVGNLLLSALTQVTGDFSQAIQLVAALLDARGSVMPSTLENVRLRAQLQSGDVVVGETAIVARRSRIARLSLSPSPKPLPDVLRALVNADTIVVGPGSLYTSVLPNLLVEGVAATIYAADAIRVYVANLMTQPGETDGYSLDDHLRAMQEHTGFDLFDYILVHRGPLDPTAVASYADQGAWPLVRGSALRFGGRARIVEADVASHERDGKIRHHPQALARAITRLSLEGRAQRSLACE